MAFGFGYLRIILFIGAAALIFGSFQGRLLALVQTNHYIDQDQSHDRGRGTEKALSPPLTLLDGEKLSLRYTVVWGLFVVYEEKISIEVQNGNYVIEAHGRTKGLAAFLKGDKSHVWVAGTYVEDAFFPRVYQNSGKSKGNKYRRTLFFGRDGVLADMDRDWPESWSEKYQREPVPETLKTGPDPISLLLNLLSPRLSLFDQNAEPLKMRAFDGQVVADYQIDCRVEQETLSPNRKSIFSGIAQPCYLTSEQVAGDLILTEELIKEREKELEKARKKRAKKTREDDEDEEDLPDDNRPKLWFASYDDTDLIIPVRGAVSGGFGTVRIYLREFKREKLKGRISRVTVPKALCQTPIVAARQVVCNLHR